MRQQNYEAATISDDMHCHPDFIAIGLEAVGVWGTALSWSTAYMSDGRITTAAVAELEFPQKLIDRLVAAGIWERASNGNGWVFVSEHGYKKVLPSTAECGNARGPFSADEYRRVNFLPLQEFDDEHRQIIERIARSKNQPAQRRFDMKCCSVPARGYYEWHLRRGRLPISAANFGHISKAMRKAVVAEHGAVCWLCEQRISDPKNLHIDHVVPKSKGGTNDPSNLRPAHDHCNISRGNKSAEMFQRLASSSRQRLPS